jgi:hypothetical protein
MERGVDVKGGVGAAGLRPRRLSGGGADFIPRPRRDGFFLLHVSDYRR